MGMEAVGFNVGIGDLVKVKAEAALSDTDVEDSNNNTTPDIKGIIKIEIELKEEVCEKVKEEGGDIAETEGGGEQGGGQFPTVGSGPVQYLPVVVGRIDETATQVDIITDNSRKEDDVNEDHSRESEVLCSAPAFSVLAIPGRLRGLKGQDREDKRSKRRIIEQLVEKRTSDRKKKLVKCVVVEREVKVKKKELEEHL